MLPRITFTWTSAALISHAKIVTRRDWRPSYAMQFSAGDLVEAWDKRQEWGGRKIALLRLTHKPKYEHTSQMPESDFRGEGLAFLTEHPEYIPTKLKGKDLRVYFRSWQMSGVMMYTVRFEVVAINVTLADLFPPKDQLSLPF